ncbi:MAG: pitrilysin family protein [Desulfurivibrionaceae bacterium]|nr:pitrilysin family protein [Desulfurivibrionaceae bacterium]
MNSATAVELAPQLYKTTLANGLTLLVKEIPSIKVATVQIWVKAGSVYEDADEAGITHLIEHMIFKGTPTRGAGGVAAAIEEVGGQINAYTSYEYTVYHATLSARHWGLALEVLTDAVLNSTFDAQELEREKKVVLEEIAMREDRPQFRLFEQLMAESYQEHPYGLPVIGTRQSVSSFSREDIIDYVGKHYHPENFTVVVVGDVKFGDIDKRVGELLGDLPKGGAPSPELPREPVRTEAGFFKIADQIRQTHMAVSFPVTPFSHPDSAVLDVIAGLLGHGDTSRLYNRLRNEEGLVYQISASAFTPRDPGLFEIFATLDSDKLKPALESALTEVFKLKYLPVDEEELARVKRSLESDFVFGLERVEGQARILGSFEFLTGDPREDAYLSRVRSVTREDVMRVAASFFEPRGLTAGYIAPENAGLNLTGEDIAEIAGKAENLARHGVPASLVADAFLPNVYQYRLANGIRLVVREDNRVETVAIRAIFPGGLRSETEATNGAFAFIAELLPKGAADLSARQLAIKIADMAGSINGFNGKNTFGVKADFLARFFEPGLGLVRDILLDPAFSEEEAEKIRPELLSRLEQQEDSLPTLAFLNFNKVLYRGHPYALNTAGREETIRAFSVDQLKEIYRRHAVPDEMVLAVSGAVAAGEVRDLVEKTFGGWQLPAPPETTPVLTEESILPPEPPGRPELVRIVKDREQLHILVGFLGVAMSSSDRFALEILDTVLSGQSGRLFVSLRDRQSLAYSLSSFSQFGLDTGSFGIYIGTSPDKKDQVIKAVWKELFKARQEPISEAELEKAVNLLIGQYELNLQTHGSQAMELGLNKAYGLGLDFGTRYVKALQEVTPPQVLDVARRYIQPDRYVMVLVGAKPGGQPEDSPETGQNSAQPEMSSGEPGK